MLTLPSISTLVPQWTRLGESRNSIRIALAAAGSGLTGSVLAESAASGSGVRLAAPPANRSIATWMRCPRQGSHTVEPEPEPAAGAGGSVRAGAGAAAVAEQGARQAAA